MHIVDCQAVQLEQVLHGTENLLALLAALTPANEYRHLAVLGDSRPEGTVKPSVLGKEARLLLGQSEQVCFGEITLISHGAVSLCCRGACARTRTDLWSPCKDRRGSVQAADVVERK